MHSLALKSQDVCPFFFLHHSTATVMLISVPGPFPSQIVATCQLVTSPSKPKLPHLRHGTAAPLASGPLQDPNERCPPYLAVSEPEAAPLLPNQPYPCLIPEDTGAWPTIHRGGSENSVPASRPLHPRCPSVPWQPAPCPCRLGSGSAVPSPLPGSGRLWRKGRGYQWGRGTHGSLGPSGLPTRVRVGRSPQCFLQRQSVSFSLLSANLSAGICLPSPFAAVPGGNCPDSTGRLSLEISCSLPLSL